MGKKQSFSGPMLLFEADVPGDFGGAKSIFHHLNDMGRAGKRCSVPIFGGLSAIMEADTQRDAGSATAASCQDAKVDKHMPMDVLGFCGICKFLKEFLNSGHSASFLRLFDSVPN